MSTCGILEKLLTKETAMYRVLLVDDSETMASFLCKMLVKWGFDVNWQKNGQEAFDTFKGQPFDLVLTDVKMSPVDGIQLLRLIREAGSSIPVIMMTGFNEISVAVEALKLGAFDYLTKPFEVRALAAIMSRALAYGFAQKGILDLELLCGKCNRLGALVAESTEMREVCSMIIQTAPTDSAVFILGEPGTGRSLVGQTMHEYGTRRDKPFSRVDCSASTVFRDTFAAEKGTVYLRHIDALPRKQQEELLQEIDRCRAAAKTPADEPRLLMSASTDLRHKVDIGEFDEGLYRELADAVLELKPLRIRKLDILPLAYDILRSGMAQSGRVPCLDLDVSVILERYPWPGNVKELRDILVRFSGSGRDRLTRNDLPREMIDKVGDVPQVTEETLKSEFLYGESLKKILRERGKSGSAGMASRPPAVEPQVPTQPRPEPASPPDAPAPAPGDASHRRRDHR